MKKVYYIISFLMVSFLLNAQVESRNDYYFSGHLGASSGGDSEHGSFRGSRALNMGIGFGMPVIDRISLFTRVSYIAKSGYTGYTENLYLDQSLESVNELISVNGSFSQLIINGGLQYKLHIIENLSAGAAGGLTYALVNHEAELANGEVIQSLDNTGVFGYFIGLTIEKEFEESDLSIFFEGIYNNAKKDMFYFRDVFSGMNITFGMKYYFSGK